MWRYWTGEEMSLTEKYCRSQLENVIYEWINGDNGERNRALVARKLFGGISFEQLAEEFELSPLDSRFGRNKNIDEKIIEISSKQRIYTNAKSNLPASHIIAELDMVCQVP